MIEVNHNRNIDKVIILGSGMSILELTHNEINYINRCKVVIAINKYILFYKKIGIIPTHVYFYDLYGYEVFNKIIELVKESSLLGLTFYVSPFLKNITYSNSITLIKNVLKDLFYFRVRSFLIILIRFNKNCDIHNFIITRNFIFLKRPNNSTFIDFKITEWDKGGEWANKLSEKIFHYRGSLTSVLNISSIIAPDKNILLVGNDFNCNKYFYEEELNELKINWKDYTYNLVKSENIHYSFQVVNGTSMIDKIPYIIDQLNLRNIKVTCNNPNSLLVKNSIIEFEPIFK